MTEFLLTLVRFIVDQVGHESAHQMVSDEAKRRANEAADAVAAARVIAESLG